MSKNKRSITFKMSMVTVIMLVMLAVFLFSLIFTIGTYNKRMKFYTQNYYRVVKLTVSVNDFSDAVVKYTGTCAEEDKSAVSEAFANFRDSLKELHTVRFKLDDEQRVLVEKLNDELPVLSLSVNSILEYEDPADVKMLYKDSFSEHIDMVEDKILAIYSSISETGSKEHSALNGRATFVQVLMVLFFIGFGAMTVFLIVFAKNRVSKPILDTCEWARVFKDSYCDMADLKFDTGDEMEELAESFNIVKNNLAKANAMKAEYEKLMQKIHNDEEHKKKFVQQLYDEKREKEAISTVAKRDGLTGLYNRRTFDGIVEEFVGKKPIGMEGALFLIDMDNFKNVNDTLGHLAGDEALKTLAGAMSLVFNGAYLGRYGGDEFTVFLAGYRSEEELEKLAGELCVKMDMDFENEGKSVRLSVSVGVSTTEGVEEYSELYMKADKALYYSKENGRNQYKLASTLE